MASRTIVRLDFPSRVQMLGIANRLVGRAAAGAGFDENARQDIESAVHEALVNAIVHGNGHDEARLVTLQVLVDPDNFEIRIQDEGEGFDPAAVPDPLAAENLSRSSGRGIFLMSALMDEVVFGRRASGGMEVTMRKRLPAGVASAAEVPSPATFDYEIVANP